VLERPQVLTNKIISITIKAIFYKISVAIKGNLQLTDYSRFEIDENCTGNVFASTSLAEEGVKAVVSSSNSLVRGHLTVRLDSMFKAVKLPAGVTNLDSSLSNVDRDALTL